MSEQLAVLGGSPTLDPGSLRRWPEIRQEDRAAIEAVLDRGIFTGGGSVEAPALAAEYAAYNGVAHCLPFNAGTAALHACLVTLGIGPGDEVIVPAFTYVGSAMPIAQAGATPVFCDVQPRTYNIDPERVEELINERTRALMIVHLHGMPADLDELLAIAAKHDLDVVEDSSQAHGARYKGKRVSNFGRCAGASLNATKNLAGGEGGLFVTDETELVTAADRLRYMGEDLPSEDPPFGRRYWSHGLGFNYRAHELPAALARSQLRRLDAYNEAAERNARRLTERLDAVDGVITPLIPGDRNSVWYIYRLGIDTVALDAGREPCELRDRVVAALNAEGVPATLWQHHPLPAYPTFRRDPIVPWHTSLRDEDLKPWDPQAYPVALSICESSLVLGTGAIPLSVQREETIDAYAAAIEKVLAAADELLAAPFEIPESSRQVTEFNRSAGMQGEPARAA